MDPERARELLAAERTRIESALSRLGHQDTGELSDEQDPANLASDLYQDEFDAGDVLTISATISLRSERAEARLAAGTYGLSIRKRRADPGRAAGSSSRRPKEPLKKNVEPRLAYTDTGSGPPVVLLHGSDLQLGLLAPHRPAPRRAARGRARLRRAWPQRAPRLVRLRGVRTRPHVAARRARARGHHRCWPLARRLRRVARGDTERPPRVGARDRRQERLDGRGRRARGPLAQRRSTNRAAARRSRHRLDRSLPVALEPDELGRIGRALARAGGSAAGGSAGTAVSSPRSPSILSCSSAMSSARSRSWPAPRATSCRPRVGQGLRERDPGRDARVDRRSRAPRRARGAGPSRARHPRRPLGAK